MFAVDGLILIAALLVLLGIASSKFAARLGLPTLVLFILAGMAAGSDGLGGIAFEDYPLAHGIATIALVMILFDGGLRTSLDAFRAALGPSLALASGGVVITALITGVAAAAVLDRPLLEGLLLGSIVGSTDAAAVFSVLRGRGLVLQRRLASTLEIESGSNDPMAVFLTVALLEVLLGRMEPGLPLLLLFAQQAVVGTLTGLAVGRLTALLVNRINLDAAGLYPVLIATAGLLAYGLAATLGGSGFLAVYLAGIVIGNAPIVFRRGVLLFHDGSAWLAQIVMFTMMGLLSFPSQLGPVAPQGLAIAAVLTFVARPLAVGLLLAPFRFPPREILFVAWVGLKGAVPIVLAIFPFLAGLPSAPLLFNVVFFVVLVSAVTQGWTTPWFARRLGLNLPIPPEPPVQLLLSSLRPVDAEIVEYTLAPAHCASGQLVGDLPVPDGAVIALIVRGSHSIPPRGGTRLAPGDHVFVVVTPNAREAVDAIFTRDVECALPPPRPEFAVSGDTTVAGLAQFYGIRIDAPERATLAEIVGERLGPGNLRAGGEVNHSGVVLSVRGVKDGTIERVGVRVPPSAQPEA